MWHRNNFHYILHFTFNSVFIVNFHCSVNVFCLAIIIEPLEKIFLFRLPFPPKVNKYAWMRKTIVFVDTKTVIDAICQNCKFNNFNDPVIPLVINHMEKGQQVYRKDYVKQNIWIWFVFYFILLGHQRQCFNTGWLENMRSWGEGFAQL